MEFLCPLFGLIVLVAPLFPLITWIISAYRGNKREAESGAIAYAKGKFGAIELYENKVIVYKDEVTGNTQKSIYISDIISIPFKEPLFGANGYIEITTVEDTDEKTAHSLRPNVLYFTASQKEEIVSLKEQLERKIHANKNDRFSTTTQPEQTNVSNADEIGKYKKLLDDGIITEQEFEFKKKQLLGMTTDDHEQKANDAEQNSDDTGKYKGIYY